MKFIFLDIDGVLNSELFYIARHKKRKLTFNFWFLEIKSKIKWILNGFKYKAVSLAEYKPKRLSLNQKIKRFKNETDQNKIKLLDSLCNETGATIVISSCWRTYFTVPEWNVCFDKLGFKHISIFDITSKHRKGCRGDEIQKWIDEHKFLVDDYAIIDDDSDMLPDQMVHFFQTDNYCGLTPTIYYKIKRFFQK